jgi:Domain of unknown function (DUF4440)
MSELSEVLDRWSDVILRRDRAAADALLADGYALSSAGGVAPHVPRDVWLDTLEQIDTRSLRTEIAEERIFGDVAVVASRLYWDASMGDRDLTGEYAVTDVFTRDGSSWRPVWRVSTRLSEGAS